MTVLSRTHRRRNNLVNRLMTVIVALAGSVAVAGAQTTLELNAPGNGLSADTTVQGGGYAAVILGLGQLLGHDSSLAVASATLAAAALFHPARRRIQAGVDRRFNRRRHDAAQKITTFSDHLREQVDLDTLTADLLAVVDQTMQPTQVSLWLRPSGSASQDQSTTGASRAAG